MTLSVESNASDEGFHVEVMGTLCVILVLVVEDCCVEAIPEYVIKSVEKLVDSCDERRIELITERIIKCFNRHFSFMS